MQLFQGTVNKKCQQGQISMMSYKNIMDKRKFLATRKRVLDSSWFTNPFSTSGSQNQLELDQQISDQQKSDQQKSDQQTSDKTARSEYNKQQMMKKVSIELAWLAFAALIVMATTTDAAELPAQTAAPQPVLTSSTKLLAADPVVADGEITYAKFISLLQERGIARVTFLGAAGNAAIAELADGSKVNIGEGYPQENPINPESPLKVAAKLRDYGVPYSYQFDLSRYSKKTELKTEGQIAADARAMVQEQEIRDFYKK
eukprot:CAMPEP_0113939752 /NCGR_PEP_ID=MMETSP1339-20121228/6018_1 /TAXON_ID=94617 /ORGANISM="Fibrocapsa japonica" /LENGTH=257 /DNA_ID=CAMNT_0000943359 /DNA_START=144 /DNA_END=917 /DNA_ORIENTATION=+ /assembly_acc=CAM_ASM_000762